MTLNEALRWADDVERTRLYLSAGTEAYIAPGVLAAELRRLQVENDQLRRMANVGSMCS